MKAAVFHAPHQPLTIEDVEIEKPKRREVLLRTAYAGLCHSDLSVINGDRPRPLPLVLGHEGSGEVVEVGSAIDDVRPGDQVVFQFSASCGRCRRCVEGRPQVCERAARAKAAGELMAGGSRITAVNGERIGHHSGLSCMAEYAVVDRGSVVVIDKTKRKRSDECHGNPIYPVTGNKVEQVDTHIELAGFPLVLIYDSAAKLKEATGRNAYEIRQPSFGALWASSFHRRLTIDGTSTTTYAAR